MYPSSKATAPVFGPIRSVRSTDGHRISVEEDKDYLRNHLVLPVPEIEGRDAIMIYNAYSALPDSAMGTDL